MKRDSASRKARLARAEAIVPLVADELNRAWEEFSMPTARNRDGTVVVRMGQNAPMWMLMDGLFVGLPPAVTEHPVVPDRAWRFDHAFPQYKVALEVNGGEWIQGRHTRPQGYVHDLEKLNAAQVAGWIVIQFTPDQLRKAWTACRGVLEAALRARGWAG